MTKDYLYTLIEQQRKYLFEMVDQIHDNPEYDGKEYKASELLENYLKKNGFTVESGLGLYIKWLVFAALLQHLLFIDFRAI